MNASVTKSVLKVKVPKLSRVLSLRCRGWLCNWRRQTAGNLQVSPATVMGVVEDSSWLLTLPLLKLLDRTSLQLRSCVVDGRVL